MMRLHKKPAYTKNQGKGHVTFIYYIYYNYIQLHALQIIRTTELQQHV